jgi:hypothetical protein
MLLPVRIPRVSVIVLSTLIAVLAGTVGYALQRELTTVPTESVAPSRDAPELKALSPAGCRRPIRFARFAISSSRR